MKNKEYETIRSLVDGELNQVIEHICCCQNPIFEVMEYGLSGGGKRIRGVLTVAFCDRMDVPREQSLPFAVALEMIHAYSLVHDDMPEMDNDDYRRGLLSCHKKYGQAMALLAGDGILNGTLEYLLDYRSHYEAERFMNALSVLFHASGANGMLGGQVLDKLGEEKKLELDELCMLHRMKTGALLLAPAEIAGALSQKDVEHYKSYCTHIGLAFQIKDDLLDVEGDPKILGKKTGKDLDENKSTFITLMGCGEAYVYLKRELEKARQCVAEDDFLIWLADYIEKREK